MAHSVYGFENAEYLGKAVDFAQEVHEVIGQTPLFGEMSRREIEALCGFMECYALPRDSVLIREGEIGDFLVLLLTGQAEVFKRTPDGQQVSIAHVGPGAALGDMSLIDGMERSATCVAKAPVDVAVLNRGALNDILVTLPRLGNKLLILLLQLMAARLRETTRRSISNNHSTAV